MTMQTYHWERKHLTEPPTTLSIMRTLPEGDWTVRSEDWTLPVEFDSVTTAFSWIVRRSRL